MCGIVGVISWSETHRVTRADLKRMTDAIAHRGPDGEGFYFNIDPDDRSQTISPENPQVAFGFRHGQPAGGQGNASQCVQAQRCCARRFVCDDQALDF